MAFQNFPGSPVCLIGPPANLSLPTTPVALASSMAAAVSGFIMVGRVVTQDGGSHTINTTGSSSIGWNASVVTFASASTTVKVGVATVDLAVGPPGRAVNSSGTITFDVSKSIIGGSGGIATGWNTHVPDTGSKTIANGDLVAICVQMTARGGSDSITITQFSVGTSPNRPATTTVVSGPTFTGFNAIPNALITFSDGVLGWIFGSEIFSAGPTASSFNSGSSPNERGQLFSLPFPIRIFGAYGHLALATGANTDLILYSDPLGTPVARLTQTIDQNTIAGTSGLRFFEMFGSTYDVAANTPVALVAKPTTANNATVYSKSVDLVGQAVVDVWGTSGYAVTRSGGSGAFAQQNSGKDNYFMGIIASAFQQPASPILGLGF